MATGTVKWFNNAKGYGFILPDNGGDDLFAHYSSIEMEGYKTLKAGQTVVFDIVDGDKGQHASNIRANTSAENSDVSQSGLSEGDHSESGSSEGNSSPELEHNDSLEAEQNNNHLETV